MGIILKYNINMSKSINTIDTIWTYGKKKNAVANARVRRGMGKITVNGFPLENTEPEQLRTKVYEPILIAGYDKFYKQFNIKVRVNGGGHVAQIYAIRQSIAKGLVAWYQK